VSKHRASRSAAAEFSPGEDYPAHNGLSALESALAAAETVAPPPPADLGWLVRLSQELAGLREPDTVAAGAAAIISAALDARVAVWQAADAEAQDLAALSGAPGTIAGDAPAEPGATPARPLLLLASAGFGQAFARLYGRGAAHGTPAAAKEAPAARAWATLAPVPVGDPSAEQAGPDALPETWRNMARREGIGGGWALPLLAGADAPVGVLECYLPDPVAADSPLRDLLRIAAGQLGFALGQTGVQEKMGRRLAEALLLREVSQMIGNSIDLEDTLAAVLASVRRLIPYTSSEITLYDADKRRLVTAAVAGEDIFVGRHHAEYAEGEGYTGWIAQHRRPLVVPDVEARADVQPKTKVLPGGMVMRAYIGLPMVTLGAGGDGDRLLGTLEVVFDQPDAFALHDVRLLQQVADEAAVAIENAQVYRSSRERLDRRLQELMVLQRIGRELNSTWDLERIFELLAREAVQATRARSAGIIQVDQEGGDYVWTTVYGLDPDRESAHLGVRMPIARGLVGRAIATGQAQLVGNVHQDPDYYEVDPAIRSELVMPIRYEDQVVGVLNLESTEYEAFDEDALRFVEALADQAAIAVGNAQNYEAQVRQGEQLLRRASQLSQVLEISNALTGEQPLPEILDQIVHAVVETAGFRTALLSMVDPAQPDVLERAAAAGLPLPVFRDLRRHPSSVRDVSEGVLRPEFRIGRAYYISHEHRDVWHARIQSVTMMDSDGAYEAGGWHPEDALLLPLTSTMGEFLGLLSVDDPIDGRRPTRAVVETLEIFANQAAIAIENAQLFARYKHRITELGTLNQLGQRLASSLTIDAIGASIYEHLRQFLPVDAFYIALYDRDRQMLDFPYNVDLGDVIALTPNRFGEGMSSEVIRTGTALVVHDLSDPTQQPASYSGMTWGHGACRTWVGVPMVLGQQVIGVLSAQSYQPNAFSTEQVQFLDTVANQAAIAIENARLFDRHKHRITELGALNQLAQSLGALLNVEAIAVSVYEHLRQLMTVDSFYIATYDAAKGLIHFPYFIDVDELLHIDPQPFGRGLASRVIETSAPLVIHDLADPAQRPPYLIGTSYGKGASRSWVGVPLTVGQEVVGVLSLQSYEPNVFSPEQVQFLSTVGNQTAVAIQNAHLFNERERRITELATLNQIARDLNTALELDPLLNLIYDQVTRVMDTNNFDIVLWHPERNELEFRLLRRDGVIVPPVTRPPSKGVTPYILSTRQPLLIQGDSRVFCERMGIPHYGQPSRSFLGVPMVVSDRVLGAILVQSTERDDVYDEEHLTLLGTIAAQAAIAIENAQLFQERERRIAELSALNEISRDLTSTLDASQLMERLLGHVIDVTEAHAGGIYRYDTARGGLRLLATRGIHDLEALRHLSQTWPVERGLMGKTYREKRTILVRDVALEPDYVDVEPGVRSELMVPILKEDTVLGVIALDSQEPNGFDDDDRRFVEQLAAQAAIALHNSRLYDEAQMRILQLDALNQLGHVLSAALDTESVFRTLYERITNFFEVSGFFVGLVDRERDMITFPFMVEIDQDTGEEQHFDDETAPMGEGLSSYIISTGKPLLIPNMADPAYGDLPGIGTIVAGSRPQASWMAAPLFVGHEVVGLLSVQTFQPAAYTQEHLLFLMTLAHHAAVAIQNARLFAEIRRFNEELEQLVGARTEELAAANAQLTVRNQRLEELYEISHQLTTTLELDEILHRGIHLATSMSGVTRGSVMLKDLQTNHLVYRASAGHAIPPPNRQVPFPEGEGIMGWVMRERKAVLVQDVYDDPRWRVAPGWGEGVRSLISVPLLSGDELLGILNLSDPEPNHFDEGHLRLVSTVANEMSIAIHNATLYSFITEQFEREAAALRVQEAETSKLNAILGSISDGVVVFDAARRVILANAAAGRLFGVPADYLIGTEMPFGLQNLDVHPDVLDMMNKLTLLTDLPDPLHPWQGRFRVADHAINVTASRVSSMEREITGVVMVFRDVTKEVEVDRMKSEFISLVSHEMRTPMTSIKGYTDLILMGSVGPVSDMQKSFLTVIKSNADRLTALVADLLDLSRIETGRIKLDLKYVQLEDLINDVLATLRTQIEAKQQHVETHVPWGLPDIKVDRDRIVQILTNLISNAHKYTPEGGTITVSVEEVDSGMLGVAVKDTGIGISAKDQERLFTRFFRADHPGVQTVSGTGLGLVIAQSLVEMHGGAMQVESALGEGSTFRFTLPMRAGEDSRPPAEKQAGAAAPGAGAAPPVRDPAPPPAPALSAEEEAQNLDLSALDAPDSALEAAPAEAGGTDTATGAPRDKEATR
jgi:PAS domain S-box-containing protein